MAEINVGNNANLLKGAIDSHDTQINNTDSRVDNSVTNYPTNNVVNHTTTHQAVYEAQKTQQEIMHNNENEFIKVVREHVADGRLTAQDEAELDRTARDWKINQVRARQIIEAERKSANVLAGGQGNEYYANKILQNIFEAVNANQTDIVKRLSKSIEELAKTMSDANVQYYNHMLSASSNPAGCVVSFVNHHTDNYWQLFWTCIAYVKLGQVQNATALVPYLGGFGGPHGDVDLLTAVENLSDLRRTGNEYYKQQLQNNLDAAVNNGMSEQLSPLWYAVKELAKDGDEPKPEEWFAFYVETTLAELGPKEEKQMSKGAPVFPEMPKMPKFDPQAVRLKQSQGWNPLQMAQQMGLGKMPSMQDTQAQINAMRNQWLGSMPQMPDMKSMPQMPVAPSAPKSVSEEELVVPEPSPTVPQERVPQYGIIFTDSLSLAEKYGCEVEEVYNVLDEFVQNSAKVDQNWYLLDAGNYRQRLGNDLYWGDYNEILSDFISDNGFQTGVATPVFIIGGSDVIPVPQLENPQYGGMIPTDMAYCFGTTFFSDLWDGDRHIANDYVRNTVSRLPLEDGGMESGIKDDLLSYFNLCSIAAEGIDVEGVAMASNAEWVENSVTMSQHLPLIYTNTDDKEETYKRMYMCPKLIAGESGDSEVDAKVLADYRQALQHAGMLLFNLHGSDGQGASGFYCNSDDGDYPESFNIGLMRESNARVLNTVACFGARYDGYERNDSMLMSSLLGGGKLLYAGATASVPMIGDEDQECPEGVTLYPGSGSEKFMPLYCYYQFCGLPAGQAMMQAKLDYFNTFRHIERDDFSLSTAMMFGLYGNPMLHVKARQDVIDEAARYEVLPQLPQAKAANAPVRVKRTKCIVSRKHSGSSKSLLGQLRDCVDGNLQAIHETVVENLYRQLNLDPRWLDEVDEYEMKNEAGELVNGYLYSYDDDNRHGRKSVVEVSRQGEITRKITFKK